MDREINIKNEPSLYFRFILSRSIKSKGKKCTEKTIREHENKLRTV